ncbi:peptidylprolyl isomerase [uncultured Lentibacter sp.]|uniref:peptidylprolyl isomerase n=1 Tax=uncultured Lentibacter sp. TaxID=1659309 RepID=UPI002604311D|nr:peptidylprolyl isomerase [uncultured Lentibacter sp.]
MSKHFKILSLAAGLALAPFAALAEDTPHSASTVVAVVDGTEITLGHLATARSRLPQQFIELEDEVLYKALLDQLINQTVLANRFEGEMPAPIQRRLDNERRSLLAATVITQIVDERLTEAALREAYNEAYEGAAPDKEYQAAHILVETQEDALALVKELEEGADFAELAKTRSTGPSGPNGGDLGWFGKGMMVPEFQNAVEALAEGAISAPVQTQFGWHVIRLNETRLADQPTFEEMRAELENSLYNKIIDEELERLRKAGDIQLTAEGKVDPAILKEDSLLTE